jgi:hypothetical protein
LANAGKISHLILLFVVRGDRINSVQRPSGFNSVWVTTSGQFFVRMGGECAGNVEMEKTKSEREQENP